MTAPSAPSGAATPALSVPAAQVHFPPEDRAEILRRIDQALATGQLTLGAISRELEERFAAHHGAKACRDCARACTLFADLCSEKSPRAFDACRLCEQLCQDCAAICAKSETEECKECAKLCRACAAACIASRR